MDGRDASISEEPRAVLPAEPPFVAGGFAFQGPPKLHGWCAHDAVFGREENIERLPDDLFGPIAEHLAGAGIPGLDPARRVQRDDGVILDAVEEEPKPRFAR